MSKSKIEWTDRVWNPVRGCSLVSAGCENCYAMKQAHRFSGIGQAYEGLTELGPHGPRWTGKVKQVDDALDAPLRWKKPARVFVNSMSDLFHQDISYPFLLSVFRIMQLRPQHTFQILTKRPRVMLDRVRWIEKQFTEVDEVFPLPNVWLGVSVEDQANADERIPLLMETPAAVRWISAEPLLTHIDLTGFLYSCDGDCNQPTHPIEPVLDWVVIGGESGPGARACDIQWIRAIKEDCQRAEVPVFVKQLGAKPFNMLKGFGPNLADKKGGDMADWPKDLRVRQYPNQKG